MSVKLILVSKDIGEKEAYDMLPRHLKRMCFEIGKSRAKATRIGTRNFPGIPSTASTVLLVGMYSILRLEEQPFITNVRKLMVNIDEYFNSEKEVNVLIQSTRSIPEKYTTFDCATDSDFIKRLRLTTQSPQIGLL